LFPEQLPQQGPSRPKPWIPEVTSPLWLTVLPERRYHFFPLTSQKTAYFEYTMYEAECDTSEPELEGPLGHFLRYFRAQCNEFDRVSLCHYESILLQGNQGVDLPKRLHHR